MIEGILFYAKFEVMSMNLAIDKLEIRHGLCITYFFC